DTITMASTIGDITLTAGGDLNTTVTSSSLYTEGPGHEFIGGWDSTWILGWKNSMILGLRTAVVLAPYLRFYWIGKFSFMLGFETKILVGELKSCQFDIKISQISAEGDNIVAAYDSLTAARKDCDASSLSLSIVQGAMFCHAVPVAAKQISSDIALAMSDITI
ncbi:MAG: hypothetical protein AAFX39_10970, partial [Pseudomonadota bacterium]